MILSFVAMLAVGCEPSVDRGASKQPPIPPAGTPQQSSFDTVPDGGSKSYLGKARDSAVRVRQQMEERDAAIGKMADDLLKPQGDPPQPTTPSAPPGRVPVEAPKY